MSRRIHLLALLFFLGVGVYWYSSRDNGSAPAPAAATPAAEQPPALSQAEIQKQFEALEKDKEASLAKLGSEEANAQLRERAATKTFQAREQVQFARQSYWAKVLSTNWPAYKKLHAQAMASPQGTAPCTICNGRGKMDFCVVCNGSGKCQTCGGTGYLPNGELCPDCLGSKICYMCNGSGKMACPFCDDGLVYSKMPPPPNLLPINCNAPETSIASVSQPPRNTDTSVLPPDVLQRSEAPVNPEDLPPSSITQRTLVMLCLLGFSLIFGILVIVRLFNKRRDTEAALARQRAEDVLREKRIFEDPAMRTFFVELQAGLQALPTEFVPDAIAALRTVHRELGQAKLDLATESRKFFDSAPGTLLWLRSCLAEMNRTTDEDQRRILLLDFSEEVRPAKIACLLPALRSFWLLSFALEGFARQLCRKGDYVTPSALRTVEGALDMLETLCDNSLRPDLANTPPIRLLAVDDDAVCRRSMTFALKKVFSEPDLAADGTAALALVDKQKYDVIFLDVDMPGINGFETCTKIREGQVNKETPVVFVTRHGDFNSRAESTLVGGQDLIAKPYLPAEITIKTLMFTLRARLESDAAKARAAADAENSDGQDTSAQSADASEAAAVTAASA